MAKVRILWVSAVSLVVLGVVGALVTLAVLSENEDTTPPIISDISIHVITHNTAQFSWTTDEPATSQVECWSTKTYCYWESLLDETLVESHTVSLSGLLPDDTVRYRVKSRDSSRNETVSEEYTFTTLGGTDEFEQPPASGHTAQSL
jgi:hypothetical protein